MSGVLSLHLASAFGRFAFVFSVHWPAQRTHCAQVACPSQVGKCTCAIMELFCFCCAVVLQRMHSTWLLTLWLS
jgi:hypothetical protein